MDSQTKPRTPSAKASARSQIIVLGMHRSGTSAMTAVMEALGAHVGDKEELTATSWENPKGFFERRDMRKLCDALLHAADADWWKIAGFEPSQVPQSTLDTLAPDLDNLVQGLDANGTWAVKEPRLCLLLPLFEKHLSTPTIVFISRNPLEVAKSLRRRNGFPIDAGLALWEAYNIAALRHSAHLPRVFVSYDALTADPDTTVRALGKSLQKLGVAGLNDEPAQNVIEQELRREQAEDIEFQERLTPSQQRLAQALEKGDIRDVPLELSYNTRCLLAEFATDEGKILGLRHELKDSIEQGKRRAREHERAIEKKNAEFEAVAVKSSRIARELEDVYHSTSWRVTAPLRRFSRAAPGAAAVARRGLRMGKHIWVQMQLRETLRRYFTLHHRERMFSEAARFYEADWYQRPAEQSQAQVAQLLGYLRSGVQARKAGRVVERQLKTWNQPRAEAFQTDINALYAKKSSEYGAIHCAVIMPTWERANSIGTAIESVQAQSHAQFTLYVLDDGSSDNTREIVEGYAAQDPRIRYHLLERGGVSKARNEGLRLANSDAEATYVFYLDSDNSWFPHYLRNMTVFMQAGGLAAGYAGIEAKNDGGDTDFFRGEDFDWRQCHMANYVDLNCFGHRRDAAPTPDSWFDTSLRRMVDWDFILRLTSIRRTAFAPYLAVSYYNGECGGRITKTEHLADVKELRARVQAKHDPAFFDLYSATENRPDWGEIRWLHSSQRIGLKIPAPYDKRAEWGDYHYAESLKTAFEAQGHRVTIDFAGDWEKRPASEDDMVIVLRGLNGYKPKAEHFNIMWNISHPDQIAYEEYEAYDLVCVASVSYAAFLRTVIRKPVACLLQCTDTSRFHPTEPDNKLAFDALFVGNSRNEYRDIVRWAIEAEADLSVYGTRWDGFIDKKRVKGANIDNAALGRFYGSAKAVLNDHWASMRDYGLVSNRIFDVLAAGGTLISDTCHSSGYLFGDAVQQVNDAQTFQNALQNAHNREQESKQELAAYVAQHHSFDARAHSLLHHSYHTLAGHHPHAGDDAFIGLPFYNQNKPWRVNVLCKHNAHGPQSSAFIRLISPLTQDVLVGKIHLNLVEDAEEMPDCDVVIVQRVALETEKKVAIFIQKCTENGTKIIVDNDDAFLRIDASHPEAASYMQKNKAMELLMKSAAQCWFSTQELADAYAHIDTPRHVVANALDPRIWRNYRKEQPLVGQRKITQIVYMGTSTHDEDFALVMPALEKLASRHPNSFEVTLVSAVRNPPKKAWVRNLRTAETARVYPRFVRWFMQQPHWDVGIAPLVDSPFNACKSDIKFLDYAALGAVPVLSDTAAYAQAKTRGLAVMAENSTEGWCAALESAVRNTQEHRNLVADAQAYLWKERSAEQMALRQWELLQRL